MSDGDDRPSGPPSEGTWAKVLKVLSYVLAGAIAIVVVVVGLGAGLCFLFAR